jgi:hypothetical protein
MDPLHRLIREKRFLVDMNNAIGEVSPAEVAQIEGMLDEAGPEIFPKAILSLVEKRSFFKKLLVLIKKAYDSEEMEVYTQLDDLFKLLTERKLRLP